MKTILELNKAQLKSQLDISVMLLANLDYTKEQTEIFDQFIKDVLLLQQHRAKEIETAIELEKKTLDKKALKAVLNKTPPKTTLEEELNKEFSIILENYPKRNGDLSKTLGFNAYCARRKEGETFEKMLEQTKLYQKNCDATGKTGTEFVLMLSTFFGRNKRYAEDWSIKTGGVKNKLNNDIVDASKLVIKKETL